MTDKLQKIREDVEKRYEYWKEKESNSHNIESEIRMSECQHLLLMLDSLQEEPVELKINKEKFRKEVEKLKSNLIHGACSSQVAMENRCKEEAYNEVLAILDSVQEEPVSDDLTDKAKTSSGWDGFFYGQGYKQAEKDLELTWEDVRDILNLYEEVIEMDFCEDDYGEVLRRFKERKEK